MKKSQWLDEFEEKVFSQRGEDGKIAKILETIGENDKWCVEFGAWDGIFNSNVWRLIKEKNYKSVMIEGAAEKHQQLVQNVKELPVIPVCAFVGMEKSNCLDHILEKTDIPLNFDVLSIDIDGNDYHVWKQIQKYRPKLLVIEFNPTIPNEVEFVQEPIPHLNQGSSAKSLVLLGKEKGYELVTTTLNNLFFVDRKYFAKFEISDNSLAALRTDMSRVTYLFSGYDGTIFVRGFGKLDLHGLPFNEKRMQMIPQFLRGYDDSGAGFSKFKKIIKKTHKSLKKRGLL